MMEILVTILIVSLGLLGIASLFARSHKIADESYSRHEALSIARQLAERIAANRIEAVKYSASAYQTTDAGTVGFSPNGWANCGATACTSLQLAAYDLKEFHDLLTGASRKAGATAVSGLTAARGCVEFLGDAALVDLTNPPRFRVSVAWQGREASAAAIDSDANNPNTCAANDYGADGRLRRLVSIEVQAI